MKDEFAKDLHVLDGRSNNEDFTILQSKLAHIQDSLIQKD